MFKNILIIMVIFISFFTSCDFKEPINSENIECKHDYHCKENQYCDGSKCKQIIICEEENLYFNKYEGYCDYPCEHSYGYCSSVSETICSQNKRCIKKCETDRDCMVQKFSIGKKCNIGTKTCIKEEFATPFEILKYYIDNIGIDVNIDQYSDYFSINSGGYNINYEQNLGVDYIAIEGENNGIIKYELDYNYRVSYKIDAQYLTYKTLGEIIPNGDFEVTDSYITNPLGEEWVDNKGAATGYCIILDHFYNNVPIMGGKVTFYYTFDVKLYKVKINILDVITTKRDFYSYEDPYNISRQIKNLIFNNIGYSKVEPYYFYENGELLLGYIIEIDDQEYKLYDSEYDGTYQSIEPIFE